MTSEIFDGDFADTCCEQKSTCVEYRTIRPGVKVGQPKINVEPYSFCDFKITKPKNNMLVLQDIDNSDNSFVKYI